MEVIFEKKKIKKNNGFITHLQRYDFVNELSLDEQKLFLVGISRVVTL